MKKYSTQGRLRHPATPLFWMVGIALALSLTTTTINACDACNLTYGEAVLTDKAESVIGKDLRRAMENQRNLRLDGLGTPSVMMAQAELLDQQTPESSGRSPRETPEVMAPIQRAAASAETLQTIAQPSYTPASHTPGVLPEYQQNADFIEIVQRDYNLPTATTSTVPQDTPYDKSFTIRLHEGQTYIGNGVVYDGFLSDGKVPGPTIIVDEGDIVEINIVNDGTIPHGASIHAAYTQTSKYLGKIPAGESARVRFKATLPGVYMYHCAPGGHAIPMHVIGGQYGMMVVRPKPGSYRLEQELGHEPNLELFMIQNELYSSGKGSIDGSADYTMFNGRLFRYVEEPIMANPGDYVRINFLNVGPNLLSTFHIVGIIWDYVYWQGHPENIMTGGQTVTAGPSDSFVIEFRMPPDEGAYTMLTHAVGSASRGAIGLIVVDGSAELEPHRTVLADGPDFSDAEIRGYLADATRVIAPFGIGTSPTDIPVKYGPEVDEVHISIIGNSYYPKVVEVAPGTKVTWTNEDAFTYLAGEFAGIHNVAATSVPEDHDGIVGPLLAHGETFSYVFEDEWVYDYICTPHPYMQGRVIVKEPEYRLPSGDGSGGLSGGSAVLAGWVLPLLILCLVLATMSFVRSGKN